MANRWEIGIAWQRHYNIIIHWMFRDSKWISNFII